MIAGRPGWRRWGRLCRDVCGRDARAPGWGASSRRSCFSRGQAPAWRATPVPMRQSRHAWWPFFVLRVPSWIALASQGGRRRLAGPHPCRCGRAVTLGGPSLSFVSLRGSLLLLEEVCAELPGPCRSLRQGGRVRHRGETERHATAEHAGGTPALPGGVPPPVAPASQGGRRRLAGPHPCRCGRAVTLGGPFLSFVSLRGSLLLLKGAGAGLPGHTRADAAEPSRLVGLLCPSCPFVDRSCSSRRCAPNCRAHAVPSGRVVGRHIAGKLSGTLRQSMRAGRPRSRVGCLLPSLLLLKGAGAGLPGHTRADAAEPSRLVGLLCPSCPFVDRLCWRWVHSPPGLTANLMGRGSRVRIRMPACP